MKLTPAVTISLVVAIFATLAAAGETLPPRPGGKYGGHHKKPKKPKMPKMRADDPYNVVVDEPLRKPLEPKHPGWSWWYRREDGLEDTSAEEKVVEVQVEVAPTADVVAA
jgi:hypothetical protein